MLVRGDVHARMGDFPEPQLKEIESPEIGAFLQRDSRYYKRIAPSSTVTRDDNQRHYEFKPHLIGTIDLGTEGVHQVWGEKGLSPCIRTSNIIMIMLGDEVVEIELEGLAALQGIPLHELPPDKDKARRAIGDAVNRTMAAVMLAPAVQYVSEYMIGCGIMRDVKLPTTTVTETLE